MLLTLRRRGFCGFSGVAGMRVLRSRKVAIDKPEPVAEPLANVFDLRVGHPTERHSKSPYSTSVTGPSGDPAAWSRAVTGCDRWSTCDAMDVYQPFRSRIMNKCNLACGGPRRRVRRHALRRSQPARCCV